MRERRVHASESTVHVPEPDVHVAAEHGVLSVELGRDRAECRRRLRAGAWTRHGNVIVTHNGPLTVEQQQWSALLQAGYGAVLAATSSMRECGVKVDPPSLPQIVVPATRSKPPVAGAVLRRSRLLSRTEVHPVRQPPVLRLARATLDATSLLRRPDDDR